MTKHERVAAEIVAGYVQSDDHNPPRYTKEQLVAEIAAKLEAEYGPVEEAVHDGLDMMIEINNHHGIPIDGITWRMALSVGRLHIDGNGVTGRIKERT